MEKERRTKALLLSTLVVVVATLSIAFAAMSRTLSINGIGKMDTASWSVYFDNLSSAKTTRGAEEVGKPSISSDKGTVQDINVKLSNPKDEISYTVDIVNDGTIDAEITMIKDIELTDVQKKVFEFKVTYTDTGEVLKDGDILPKDTVKNITINIKFKDDITEFDLPSESQTINLSYQITYTQYDGNEIVIEPDGGEVELTKAVLAGYNEETGVAFNDDGYNTDAAESITFLDHTNVPEEDQYSMWDASEAKDGSVVGWFQDMDSNGYLEVYFGGDGGVYAPSICTYLFMHPDLKEINFNGNFNTSNVTNMSYMFEMCFGLTELNLSGWDASEVTDVLSMFSNCSSLTNINLDNINLSSLSSMSSMFFSCESLAEVSMNNIKLSGAVEMFDIFSFSTISTINFSVDKSSDVEIDMGGMFLSCEVTTLNLSSFDTSNVTDMSGMFSSCSSLTELDLRNADFSNVTNYSGMFSSEMNPQIIVKDETQRTWITSKFTNLTNVVLPSEL